MSIESGSSEEVFDDIISRPNFHDLVRRRSEGKGRSKRSESMLEDLDFILEWLNEHLGIEVTPDSFVEDLKDGMILCEMTNVLSNFARRSGTKHPPPQGIKRYNTSCEAESIQARDNVTSFSTWCMLYGVPPVLLVSPDDIVMGRNPRTVLSLLHYLQRKSASYTRYTPSSPLTHDHVLRRNSVSVGSNLRLQEKSLSFTRTQSVDVNSIMTQRTQLSPCEGFRTRSRSVESDGSTCSNGSTKRINSQNEEAMEIIKDLNLACRNISKKVVVNRIDVPGTEQEELRIDRSLEKESQACLRRQNRLFKKSNTVADIDCSTANKRRFLLKSPGFKRPGQLDITNECLSYEDIEYILLSSPDSIITKIKAVYKLISLRVIENNSREGNGVPLAITTTDYTKNIYPPFHFVTHSNSTKQVAFKQLRDILMTSISQNKDITFGEIYQKWNTHLF